MSTPVQPSRVTDQRTLLEVALDRLNDAALAVMRSAATNEEQHEILGCLVGAHSLLHALVRLDPAAVDELLARAMRLARQVGQPKTAPTGHQVVGTPAGRLQEVGPASPTTTIPTTAAEVDVDFEAAHAVGV
jgi:hypothetical protein